MGVFGHPSGRGRVLVRRRKKTAWGVWGRGRGNSSDQTVRRVRDLSCGDTPLALAGAGRRVACQRGGPVKREPREWLADNPFDPKRFAFSVGRRGRAGTSKDVARERHPDWHPVKELEQQSRREPLRRGGLPGPKGIGIDEISIRKGRRDRMVVRDL